MVEALRANRVEQIAFVPDVVLADMIAQMREDDFFKTVTLTREEEGVGVLSGAFMGGRRGALLMQSSGFGNCPNALASLAVPFQIPFLMLISLRGELGEFNPVQVPMGRALRSILDNLDIPHVTIDDEARIEELVDDSAKLAYDCNVPVALILPRALTGGKRE